MTAAARLNVHPRVSALLASEAPVGIVFRRGPSKLVRVIKWDRERDQFTPGQWFKGRLYSDRSDISPDGRFLLYFAMGGVKWAIPATGGTWTAISRIPSLTALALWGHGDTWAGGGMFTSNSSYWLNADANTNLIRDTMLLQRRSRKPARSRLERDGWVCTQGYPWNGVLEKRLRNNWILRLSDKHGQDRRYELEQPEDQSRLAFPDWEWAEWDRERLVWAEAGRLRAASPGSHKLGTIRTLYDFNAMRPAPEPS